MNKAFFDLCDGILVNYTWKVGALFLFPILNVMCCFYVLSMKCFFSTLQEDYPKLSANVAGDRKFDVHMGIDVFGRNTFGGGQWNVSIFLQ